MQSKGEIAIFSKGSANPLHPRIALEIDILQAKGYAVSLFTPEKTKSSLKSKLLNALSLSLFKWELVFEFSNAVQNFETVIVYDSQLLPLGKFRGGKNKQLIFETLDDNVELVCYHIFSKLPLLKFLEPLSRKYLKKREHNYLKKHYNNTIVNSKRLVDVFKNHQPVLNFYASPFEKSKLECKNSVYNPALLYLGKISEDKGLSTMLELAKKQKLKLFLFGDLEQDNVTPLKDSIVSYSGTTQVNKLSISELHIQLQKLAETHHLIGVSLIKPVHISYQFQDANKDIDYLALNVPFIGNNRPTTKQIIDDGCGALIDNENQTSALIDLKENYELAAINCEKHYQQHFSQAKFTSTLLQVID
jgi:hypothetical protein